MCARLENWSQDWQWAKVAPISMRMGELDCKQRQTWIMGPFFQLPLAAWGRKLSSSLEVEFAVCSLEFAVCSLSRARKQTVRVKPQISRRKVSLIASRSKIVVHQSGGLQSPVEGRLDLSYSSNLMRETKHLLGALIFAFPAQLSVWLIHGCADRRALNNATCSLSSSTSDGNYKRANGNH